MVELVQFRPDLFPKLYDAFLHDDDPLSDEQDWRNVFNYSWPKQEDYAGYALLDDGKAVGMMAMAFSTRWIGGREQKFCNLHTWWVHEAHRGRSIVMMRPLLGLKDYTITHFTPCDRVRALTKRLGFESLDLQMKVLPPVLGSRQGKTGNTQIQFDGDIEASSLGSVDRKIMDDHLPYRVGNLLLQAGSESCYVLYTHVQRYRVPYCHIHYFGNREVFARHEALIRSAILKRHRVSFAVVDSRLVRDIDLRFGFDFWTPANAVYRPANGVTPDQVDNLYSDVVMLRLAVMPHITHEIGAAAGRWFGRAEAATN
ncbi:MAG: hypothetical protein JJ969_04715 [Rhizobiaceae bacterium]|nr:hypothetical protein [Rhizobiaceae bacterium]